MKTISVFLLGCGILAAQPDLDLTDQWSGRYLFIG